MDQQIKTTIVWDPSPTEGVIGYGIKVVINGKTTVALDRVSADVCEYTITAERREGRPDHVVCFVAPCLVRDNQEIWGRAQILEFMAIPDVPPLPCGQPKIVSVSSSLPVLRDEQTPSDTRVMVTGHPEIIDGAIGKLVGIRDGKVQVDFSSEQMCGELNQSKGIATYLFGPEPQDFDVTLIRPDQTTCTVAEFLEQAAPAVPVSA